MRGEDVHDGPPSCRLPSRLRLGCTTRKYLPGYDSGHEHAKMVDNDSDKPAAPRRMLAGRVCQNQSGPPRDENSVRKSLTDTLR